MIAIEKLVNSIRKEGNIKFALLSHQVSYVSDILHEEFGNMMKCLFSAEHGWFGFAAAGEHTITEIHPHWSIPVYSLYGSSYKPTSEMLDGIDRIIIDIQDIGVRCYTYLATIKNMLETAAKYNIPITILDRPIPLGGIVDGPTRCDELSSFVAPINVPLCHGMTPAECAKYIVKEENLEVNLTTIQLSEWNHAVHQPWANFIPPSPGIKSWDSAVIYPATVLTEAIPSLDCDRYGSLAFRVLGAPWLDAYHLVKQLFPILSDYGMKCRAIKYKPEGGRYKGEICNGILLSISSISNFKPVSSSIAILKAIELEYHDELFKEDNPEWLDKLTGVKNFKDILIENSYKDIISSWQEPIKRYINKRVNLYK